MEAGLNIDELYEIGAHSIVECILCDCDYYNLKIIDNESVRLRDIVLDEKDSMTICFDIWNGKQWEDSNVPYPFYRSENEELFLEVLEEIENISELKPFVEYF